ncbi:MAG: transglutaminase domain-containing protein [Paenibacillaceae bacterium]|nr:transglutaminase domain-containing protein [Paenibacillaceae bacterium]
MTVLLIDCILTIASVVIAWQLMEWLSPLVADWLESRNIRIPTTRDIGWLERIYYTFATGLRDFSLMRSGILFLLGYIAVKSALHWAAFVLVQGGLKIAAGSPRAGGSRKPALPSSAAGAAFGAVTGAARALIVVCVLFVYTSLFPSAPFTGYVQHSDVYRTGAQEVIQPFAGDFITRQLPVFTRAVEDEFSNILQRKYEVIDARIPDDITLAAKEITAKATTDEEKAKALYQWIGTRVKYDWDKVKLYEDQRIWKEQTPEDTFRTKLGVCIDYSRLYASMARAIDLDVKVITGLGYDGRGGYGPHAWNEVYLTQRGVWVPLDSTWVSSGGNWFDPPNFSSTHIKDT